ncbi:hypothetical protein VNO77_14175 [Canavalia gladiata]|uniref:Uncharacterized protein n=1 Tax=Canavalia gladiata TaxID=3824 RepID=A0AAN9LXZ0_CANGL
MLCCCMSELEDVVTSKSPVMPSWLDLHPERQQPRLERVSVLGTIESPLFPFRAILLGGAYDFSSCLLLPSAAISRDTALGGCDTAHLHESPTKLTHHPGSLERVIP